MVFREVIDYSWLSQYFLTPLAIWAFPDTLGYPG